jgi:nitroimidazol reductase NimA-like FMN-containing flavoprotein (pyridoxamine 5'-phosphate oxidase superfamily)
LNPNPEQIARLRDFFKTQKLTALATQEPEHPYLSLMAFAFTDDLNYMIVATKRGTRKYSNMIKAPGVAFLIDNRLNQANDFEDTLAVTGIGRVEEINDSEKKEVLDLFLSHHPELEAFGRSLECALMKIKIHKFIIVSRFQEVEELEMT